MLEFRLNTSQQMGKFICFFHVGPDPLKSILTNAAKTHMKMTSNFNLFHFSIELLFILFYFILFFSSLNLFWHLLMLPKLNCFDWVRSQILFIYVFEICDYFNFLCLKFLDWDLDRVYVCECKFTGLFSYLLITVFFLYDRKRKQSYFAIDWIEVHLKIT